MSNGLDILTRFRPANDTVFLGDSGTVSWEEFISDIKRFAAFFAARSEKAFLLYTENPVRFATWFFGLLVAGKEVILPPHVKSGMLSVVRPLCSILVTDEKVDFETISPISAPAADFPLEDLKGRFVTFFTSGSTNEPKPIRKTFESLITEAVFHTELWPLQSPRPVVIASIHMHHMYGMLRRLLVPLVQQVPIDSDLILSPEDIIAKQKKYDSVMFLATPSLMDQLAAAGTLYVFLKNCQWLMSSGSLLKAETAAKMKDLFGFSPVEVFGSTEAGGVAWRRQEDGPLWHIFKPVQMKTDSENRPVITSAFSMYPEYVMQDAVRWHGPDTFELLGRTDRMVKIAENRISLPEVENRFGEHPFISSAHVRALPGERIRLGAVLTLTPEGKAFLKQNGKIKFVQVLREAMSAFFEPAVFPKKIRIVYELPVNAQGKLVKEAILSLFETTLSEPIIECRHRTENSVEADVFFPSDALYFEGHFPGFPLLPGVVQVHFARHFAEIFFHCSLIPVDISQLKFSRMIYPDETVQLFLTRLENSVHFRYEKDGILCSQGILKEEKNV